LRRVAALWLCVVAGSAWAQFSGTVSAVSDYRYRGYTLSDRKPAAQVGGTYDDPAGWYVGAFGSTVRIAPPAGINVQVIGFAGYARRLSSSFSVEAGGDYTAFTGSSENNYGEFFLGGAMDNLSARVYYSPRYFGLSSNAWYAELNLAQPLFDRVRLTAHVGFLRTNYPATYGNHVYYGEGEQHIVDGRIGLGFDFELGRVEVAWVGVSAAGAAYPITGTRSPNTVVLSLSHSF
jgi:uncharacterized protein (TIGR02001 family)